MLQTYVKHCDKRAMGLVTRQKLYMKVTTDSCVATTSDKPTMPRHCWLRALRSRRHSIRSYSAIAEVWPYYVKMVSLFCPIGSPSFHMLSIDISFIRFEGVSRTAHGQIGLIYMDGCGRMGCGSIMISSLSTLLPNVGKSGNESDLSLTREKRSCPFRRVFSSEKRKSERLWWRRESFVSPRISRSLTSTES